MFFFRVWHCDNTLLFQPDCLKMDFKGSRLNFVNIFAISDFFVGTIGVLFFFAKDGLDFVVQLITTISNEQYLEGLFNSDTAFESFVVHEELNQIEKFAWFKSWL